MPRVVFARDYDHRAKAGVVLAYKAGWSGLIPTAHANAARAAGVLHGNETDRPGTGAGEAGADSGGSAPEDTPNDRG